MDFRELRHYAVYAVQDLCAQDSRWKWRICGTYKDSMHIEWGYLTYLGEVKNFFIIRYSHDVGTFATYSPNDELIDIADTIEEAVMQIGHYAHSRY